MPTDEPRAKEGEARLRRPAAWPPPLLAALFTASLALLVWAVVVAVTGGFSLRLGPLRLSSHRVLPPLLAALLVALGTRRLVGSQAESVWGWLGRRLHVLSPALVAGLTALVVAVGVAHTSRVAGGSDTWGYLSQAELWMRGQPIQTEPLAFSLGRRVPTVWFAPLGYKEGPRRGSIVPTYPPGFPLLMAAAGLAFGRQAFFLVVPFCGGLLVALTYAIGRFVGDRFAGLVSASLLAASPTFLMQLIQPMSDIPAAAAWTAALAFGLWGNGPGPALGSGLAVSLAILIRPNLVPLAGAVALLVFLRPSPRRLRGLAAFAAGVVPGIVTLAAVNRTLYGSAFLSGYGDVSNYFTLAHVTPNLALYPGWLVETQGPFVFLALLAPLVLRRAGTGEPGHPQPPLMALTVFLGLLGAIYALYLPFENWTYVRFLLPGLPIGLALAVASSRASLRRVGVGLRVPVLVALVAASLAWSLDFAARQSVLKLAVSERRYVTVGDYVARTLPERSVLFCVLHSGSLRYYAQRETVRFDWLASTQLEPLMERLERLGYHPYFVLEDWEEPLFRHRFASQTPLGALDWPPLARLQDPGVVSIYDPRDRERRLRGEVLTTQPIE